MIHFNYIGSLLAKTEPSQLNSRLPLKLGDFVAKPPLEGLFALGGIQSGDGSAFLIERDMVTRDVFAFVGLRDVLRENAFSARMST